MEDKRAIEWLRKQYPEHSSWSDEQFLKVFGDTLFFAQARLHFVLRDLIDPILRRLGFRITS